MNIFQKIKVLFKIKRSIDNIKGEIKMNKPFYQSTRFWITVFMNMGSFASALSGVVTPQTALIIAGLYNGFYAALKTLEAQPSITTIVDNSANTK